MYNASAHGGLLWIIASIPTLLQSTYTFSLFSVGFRGDYNKKLGTDIQIFEGSLPLGKITHASVYTLMPPILIIYILSSSILVF